MRSLVLLLAIAAAGCGVLGQSEADPSVSVVVTDAETDERLPGSRVTLDGYPAREVGEQGVAVWRGLSAGAYTVRAEAPGWQVRDTVVVVAEGRTTVTLVLPPDPDRTTGGREAVDLLRDPVNTRVLQRRGFYQRRETQTGAFLTGAELSDRGVRQLSDAMGLVSGIRVDRTQGLARVISERRRECPLALFLDGVEARSLGSQIDAVPFDDIAGIEVYRGVSEVPSEFFRNRAGGDCGVILLWTVLAR